MADFQTVRLGQGRGHETGSIRSEQSHIRCWVTTNQGRRYDLTGSKANPKAIIPLQYVM
jgi:hypothetical protein